MTNCGQIAGLTRSRQESGVRQVGCLCPVGMPEQNAGRSVEALARLPGSREAERLCGAVLE